MLDFSFRQIKLLDHLFDHHVSKIDDLLHLLNISLRTLQYDIENINEGFENAKIDLKVSANYHKTYCLINNDYRYVEIKNEARSYLNLHLNNNFYASVRIPLLVRSILTSKNYIKSEDLQAEYFISASTLSKDLKDVRRILKYYEIELITKPYAGMKAVGHEFDIMSCLIDFCDIYDIQSDIYFFRPKAFDQYHIDEDQVRIFRHKIIKVLEKYKLNIKDQYFIDILFFVLITKSLDLTFTSRIRIADENIMELAQNITRDLDLDESAKYYMTLLLCNGLDRFEDKRVLIKSKQISQEIINRFKEHNNLDLSVSKELVDLFGLYVLKMIFNHRYHFSIQVFKAGEYESIKNAALSSSVALYILEYFKTITSLNHSLIIYASLTIDLYGYFYSLHNEYKRISLAIVSSLGERSSKAYLEKLIGLDKYNIDISFINIYEILERGIDRYDNVLLLGYNDRIFENEDKIIYLKYYEKISNENFYERILARHRIIAFPSDKLENKLVTVIDENLDSFKVIREVLSKYGLYEMINFNIIKQYLTLNSLKFKHETYIITLFSTKNLSYNNFVFKFNSKWSHRGFHLRELQIFVIDPKNKLNAIKQGDSYLRRYQNKL